MRRRLSRTASATVSTTGMKPTTTAAQRMTTGLDARQISTGRRLAPVHMTVASVPTGLLASMTPAPMPWPPPLQAVAWRLLTMPRPYCAYTATGWRQERTLSNMKP